MPSLCLAYHLDPSHGGTCKGYYMIDEKAWREANVFVMKSLPTTMASRKQYEKGEGKKRYGIVDADWAKNVAIKLHGSKEELER